MLRRLGLPALALVTWAGCFDKLDFENIACDPGNPSSCPKHFVCTTEGVKSFCRRVQDGAVPASGDVGIDEDALSDGGPDESRDAARDSSTKDLGAGTEAADGRTMDVGEDRPAEWPYDGGLDTPVDAGGAPETGGLAQDAPMGTAGASGSGGATGTGGITGTGGTKVDAAVSGGSVSQGGSSAGAVTGGAGSGGGTGGTGAIGGVSTVGGSSSTGLGGTGGTSAGGGSTGGTSATGGLSNSGGTTETGGSSATGGTSTGGVSGTGGSGGGTGGSGGTSGGLVVRLDLTKQTIDGFGINDTWNPLTAEQAAHLFNATDGLGLTILRVGMNAIGDFYNGGEAANIETARSYGATKIIGTTWSPPASFKEGKSLYGGYLSSSYYEAWATTLAKFATDHDLYAMSPQTEPDFVSCGTAEPCLGSYDSTLYTADQMVVFIRDHLGPKLQAANIKLIAPEPSQWQRLWTNESACCSVPSGLSSTDPLGGQYDYGHALKGNDTAWGFVDIIGTHQYFSQTAEPWPSDVPQTKPLWMTEMSGLKWWPEGGESVDMENGLAVAGWIHDALVNGDASAWLWWWYKATGADNAGLVLYDLTDTRRHYVLGQFSRFIRPGYIRVSITGNIPSGVLLSAYKGDDGTVVIVAINNGNATASLPLSISGGTETPPPSLTPWVTSADAALTPAAAVTVSNGSFTAALAARSVTTFVGKGAEARFLPWHAAKEREAQDSPEGMP